jgi:pyrimidine operon attenuation protein / uracil phosphoribosyltransferase
VSSAPGQGTVVRAALRRPRCYGLRVPLTGSREAQKGGELEAEKVVLDGDDMRRTLVRIAHEIVEKSATGDGTPGLAVVGIHRRGAILARRLHDLLSDLLEREVPRGDLDISFYRDDLGRRTEQPIVHSSHLDFPVDGMTVVIVDDVLYTGRTVRAAIEALFDYGRPARVQLAVLVDRGHRELPIRPDYVGKNLPTALSERVNVHVAELDGADEVTISTLQGATA